MADSTKSNAPFGLRMRNVPKPEYWLMKEMVKQWHVHDESELFSVLLRLGYEVSLYQDGEGQQWIVNVIDCMRRMSDEQRVYDLSTLELG